MACRSVIGHAYRMPGSLLTHACSHHDTQLVVQACRESNRAYNSDPCAS